MTALMYKRGQGVYYEYGESAEYRGGDARREKQRMYADFHD